MDYSSNSERSKEAAKEQTREKIKGSPLRGTVTKKKKSKAEKTATKLFGRDIHQILSRVEDSAERNFMKGLNGALHGAVDAFTGGYGRGYDSDRDRDGRRYVSYDRPSYDAREADRGRPRDRSGRRKVVDYDDFLFSNYDDADAKLFELRERLKTYPSVSIGDYYELMDEPCTYTYYEWGWKSLESAYIDDTRDGKWVIRFPDPRPIKR